MAVKNRTLLIIALIALVNMLGYGIVIPILYAYSKKFGLSDFENGLLFSLFSVCQFISTPLIGRMSDKYGRRPLLLISIIGTAVSFIIMAFAPSAIFLFIARALDGLTAGNIPVAFAVISDSTKPEERPKAFGMIGAAFNFGFVFGPAISAFTIVLGTTIPFMIAAVITMIAVLLTWMFLPETNTHMGEVKKGKLFDFARLWHTLFDENLGAAFLISLLFFLAFSCGLIYGFQPYALNVLKITEAQNAWLFTSFGIVGLITQTYLVQRFTKQFGLKRAFSIGLLGTAAAFLIMFGFRSIPAFIGGMILIGLFNSIAQTLIPTIISDVTDANSQGSIMGLNTSYQSVGMVMGPLLGGLIATVSIPLTFLTASGLIFICYLLSFRVMRPNVKPETAFEK